MVCRWVGDSKTRGEKKSDKHGLCDCGTMVTDSRAESLATLLSDVDFILHANKNKKGNESNLRLDFFFKKVFCLILTDFVEGYGQENFAFRCIIVVVSHDNLHKLLKKKKTTSLSTRSHQRMGPLA